MKHGTTYEDSNILPQIFTIIKKGKKDSLTKGMSFEDSTTTPEYFGVFSEIRDRPDLYTWLPYMKFCSADSLIHILFCKMNLHILSASNQYYIKHNILKETAQR